MFLILGFIIACFAWQAIKDAFRGGRKRVVTVSLPKREKAKCGCEVVVATGTVVAPCAAHKIMTEVDG